PPDCRWVSGREDPRTTEPRLAANTDLNYAGFDLSKPDSIPDLLQTGVNQPTRIDEWLKEFKNYERRFPWPG
ncbi:MAG: hypothetical protein ACM35G_10740, partial [Planctomycetaceae bacterium]